MSNHTATVCKTKTRTFQKPEPFKNPNLSTSTISPDACLAIETGSEPGCVELREGCARAAGKQVPVHDGEGRGRDGSAGLVCHDGARRAFFGVVETG
eukprot:2941947-Rhodomonas_salina.3